MADPGLGRRLDRGAVLGVTAAGPADGIGRDQKHAVDAFHRFGERWPACRNRASARRRRGLPGRGAFQKGVTSISCLGLPQPRSSSALQAATEAEGFFGRIQSTRWVMASSVCSRAVSAISTGIFGRPPGLPLRKALREMTDDELIADIQRTKAALAEADAGPGDGPAQPPWRPGQFH